MDPEPQIETAIESVDLVDSIESDEEILVGKPDEEPVIITETVFQEPKPIVREKRGIPKSMLANQKKYQDALDRQQAMGKKANQKPTVSVSTTETTLQPRQATRRIVVGGRVRHIPIVASPPEKFTTMPATPVAQAPTVDTPDATTPTETIPESVHQEPSTPGFSRKPSRRIPQKFALQNEMDIKKKTISNVKTFAELRKVATMQTLNPTDSMDITKASIAELRKLKLEQRKQEQEAHRRQQETTKNDSVLKNIMGDENLSQYGKLLAIKKLSAGNRSTRQPVLQSHA